jgi:hypothetical protein
MSQWFVESNNQIQGPFTADMVKSRLASGTFDPTDLVWGRVLEEWRPLNWWMSALPELMQQAQKISNPEIWHYAYQGSSYGPLPWADLIHNLKSIRGNSLDHLTQIMIWTRGMKEWVSVLEFHEIMDALEVNKRESPRAPLEGRAVIKYMGNVTIAPLKNVSAGGFGCEPTPNLIPGEEVLVEIHSDALGAAVHAKAQVRYSTDRLVGFKFLQINVESRGALVQYVRKATTGTERFFIKSA